MFPSLARPTRSLDSGVAQPSPHKLTRTSESERSRISMVCLLARRNPSSGSISVEQTKSGDAATRPGAVDETALRTAQEYVKPPAVPPYRYAQAENPGLCPWRSGVRPPSLSAPSRETPATHKPNPDAVGERGSGPASGSSRMCYRPRMSKRRTRLACASKVSANAPPNVPEAQKKRDSELGHIATAAGRKCAWGFSSITARKGISNACVLVVSGDDGHVNPNGSVHRVAHLT